MKYLMIFIIGLLALSGCSDNQIDAEVNARLDTAVAEPDATTPSTVLPIPQALPRSYQAAKDPFYHPNRQASATGSTLAAPTAVSADKSADAKPSANTAVKPDDKSDNKQQSAQVKTQAKDQSASHSDTTAGKPSITRFRGKPIRIDTARTREPLEAYDLNSLRYQGSISDGSRAYALIMSPDGLVHKAAVGQYLGRQQGRITAIDKQMLQISEAVFDGENYYQQSASLPFMR